MNQIEEQELKCEKCGSTINLDYHHDSYDPEIVRVLCRSCHRKIHFEHPELPKRPKNFVSKIPKNKSAISRVYVSITLPKECVEWIDRKVRERIYFNRSHAIEVLIMEKIKMSSEETLLKEAEK